MAGASAGAGAGAGVAAAAAGGEGLGLLVLSLNSAEAEGEGDGPSERLPTGVISLLSRSLPLTLSPLSPRTMANEADSLGSAKWAN